MLIAQRQSRLSLIGSLIGWLADLHQLNCKHTFCALCLQLDFTIMTGKRSLGLAVGVDCAGM